VTLFSTSLTAHPDPVNAVTFDTAIPFDDCRYSTCFNHDPGLGFFMVVVKNVISTMLQSFMAMIIVTILWVVI
jgi:Amt family ammonium transporter